MPRRWRRSGVLSIRMFEAGDAFRLLGAVGAVSGAENIVTFSGGYETREGGSFEMEFRGPPEDAQPVKEFLDPQLRDAVSTDLQAGFELTFTAGLDMPGDAAEKFHGTPLPLRQRRGVRIGDREGQDLMARLERNRPDRNAGLRAAPKSCGYAVTARPTPSTRSGRCPRSRRRR